MEINNVEIGRNIKAKREAKHMKQAELAERVGVSSQHISHIETSQTTPSLPLFLDIARALDTDLNTLVGLNLPKYQSKALDARMAELMADATDKQRDLCVKICSEVVSTDI